MKTRYELDPHNRLLVIGPGGLRKVLDGTFKAGDGNELLYHIKQPVAAGEPQQVKFTGKWGLDNDGRLIFTLDKWGEQVEGNKLILQAKILSANADELVFALTSREGEAGEKVTLLKLAGSWQVDPVNRLSFSVEKGDGASDILKFRGSWTINKKNELQYVFSKAHGKAARHGFVLRGRWDISSRNRLTYVIDRRPGSTLDFKAELERVATDRLVYSVGIGTKPAKKRIALLGSWKFDKKYGLAFEVAYADGRVERIAFGAEVKLPAGKTVALALRTSDGKDLSAVLTVSKRLLGGDAFLRLQKDPRGASVFAGFGKEW